MEQTQLASFLFVFVLVYYWILKSEESQMPFRFAHLLPNTLPKQSAYAAPSLPTMVAPTPPIKEQVFEAAYRPSSLDDIQIGSFQSAQPVAVATVASATKLYNAENFIDALYILQSVEQQFRQDFEAKMLEGDCYRGLHLYKLAIQSYVQATYVLRGMSDERRCTVWYALAECYMTIGNTQKATDYYMMIVRKNVAFGDALQRYKNLV